MPPISYDLLSATRSNLYFESTAAHSSRPTIQLFPVKPYHLNFIHKLIIVIYDSPNILKAEHHWDIGYSIPRIWTFNLFHNVILPIPISRPTQMIFSQKPFYFCFSTSPLIPCSLNIVNQFLFPLKQPLFPAAFPFPCFFDKITNSIHLSFVVVCYAIQSPTSIFKGAIYYPFVQPKYCLAATSHCLSHSIQTAIILRFPFPSLWCLATNWNHYQPHALHLAFHI